MQGEEEQKEEEEVEKLINVPEANAALDRTGLNLEDVLQSLPWQRVFDESLVLHRDHCEVRKDSAAGREHTVKALAKVFPDDQAKCDPLFLIERLLRLHRVISGPCPPRCARVELSE